MWVGRLGTCLAKAPAELNFGVIVHTQILYRSLRAGLIRSSPGVLFPSWPGWSSHTDLVSWLCRVWSHPENETALTLASPALAERARLLINGEELSESEIGRIAITTARYLIRAHRRATPFGAFSGVGSLIFGSGPAAGLVEPVLVMGAHAEWTASLVAELEADPGVRARVPVATNDTLLRETEQLVVLAAPHGASAPLRSSEVMVRCTPVVDLVTDATSTRARTGTELIRALDERFPGHGGLVWDGLLARLIEHGLLVSQLRPHALTTDGLAHVLEVLRRYGLADLPQVAGLKRIHAELRAAAPVGPTRSLMRAVSEAVDQPVTAAVRVPEARMPVAVADEAAAAATALWRASPARGGSAWSRRFHDRFVGRYGIRTVVPVSEVVESTRGLGRPVFTDQGGDHGEAFSSRNRTLLGWAHHAAVQGTRELVLTESMLDDLTADHQGPTRPAPHLEVCAHVLAPAQEELSQDRYELWVTGMGSTAMALSGRFVDLLDPEHREELLKGYAMLPTAVEGARSAQLAFAPLHPHLENVTRTTQLLPEVLSVGGRHSAGDIALADLAVTADESRSFLISLSRGCVVEPVVTHAASRTSWPALARFLWEIARSGTAGVTLWSWGALASELPYLPRVRYGRSVLAPARWRLDDEALPPKTAPQPVWERALDQTREHQGWPRWVNVGERDRLLCLDLEAAMDRTVLRDHLNRTTATSTVVYEAPDPAGYGWNNGHAHEIVVPLACTTPPAPAPAWVSPSQALPVFEDQADLPGQGVLTVHLDGAPDHAEAILTRYLPALVSALGDPAWWFVRYRHPGHHLRVRLHHPDHGTALPILHTWARDLHRRGVLGSMSLHTYRPETSRYGVGEAMRAAEKVFAADSTAAQTHLLFLKAHREIDPRALTAASMTHLARSLAPSPAEGDRWLLDLPRSGPALPRQALRQAIRLASPDTGGWADTEGGKQLVRAWKERATACAHYAHTLAGTALSPAQVLVSLLHMHHNRALGIDPEGEEEITRMARAVALSYQARKGAR